MALRAQVEVAEAVVGQRVCAALQDHGRRLVEVDDVLDHRLEDLQEGASGINTFLHGRYRVTIQVVPNLLLTSKEKFCFSMRPMY